MIYEIYDSPEDKGIDLEFDFESGFAFRVSLTDEGAQQMIDLIQNKLNARIP